MDRPLSVGSDIILCKRFFFCLGLKEWWRLVGIFTEDDSWIVWAREVRGCECVEFVTKRSDIILIGN